MSAADISPTLVLVDAYALIFRAYYAFINSRMTNARGLNTSAIYGFTAALEDVIRTQKPTHIGVVFDPSGPTFRNELYPPYKANREETPEPIKIAVPWIKKVIEAWNIPILEVPGFEADDVIGTMSRLAEKKGFYTLMVTPDKDFTQLVTPRVKMLKPGRSGGEAEIIGPEEVLKRFQIEHPSQVIDILALWGDTSDNVPGAPGIGEKGAIKLISQFKSIENLYANINLLPEKTRNILLNNKELIELSKQLVTINCSVPVEFIEPELKMTNPDLNKISEIYSELDFRSLLNRLRQNPPLTEETPSREKGRSASISPAQPTLFPAESESPVFSGRESSAQDVSGVVFKTIRDVPHEYRLLVSEQEVQDLAAFLKKQKEFCFDTETTSLDTHTADLVGISIAVEPGKAWFVYTWNNEKVIEILRPVLEEEAIGKIGQNMKFDLAVLAHRGIHVRGELFDTMVAHYLLQPEERHSMDYLARKFLGYDPVPITELIGEKGKNQLSMAQVKPEEVSEYAAEDADITLQLKTVLEKLLSDAGLMPLFREIEMPLVSVLTEMECTGVKIDTEALNEYALLLTREMNAVEEEIYSLAGTRFNIGSPKQLGEVLFEKLKIAENVKKTKTKQYATSEEVLLELRTAHPVVEKILDYRSYKKLLSTYVEALPRLINPTTGKIHTSYNQTIVATGRLSSTNPNLQNIPVRDERGREIRKAFIPSDPQGCLLSADYSQIELRIMAHFSEDPSMIEAFERGEDIHAATAAKIYQVPREKVTREMRNRAKTANFGIIYGISAFGLSQRLGIPRREAEELIQEYFHNFPGVHRYMQEAIRKAREKGFAETMFGRRRFLPDINSQNGNIRGMAERNAINTPIQGTAADIIKLAMIRISNRIHQQKLRSRMVMQVHDELVFDVAPGEV
ncbi:MAG TPA: DNA polymerase I, partial [Bacteroidales bacterium]|nr:DNA polymerase I [Bacteroidales bacterium]